MSVNWSIKSPGSATELPCVAMYVVVGSRIRVLCGITSVPSAASAGGRMMADPKQEFVDHLDQLKVPIFTAPRSANENEFTRPRGWSQINAASNRDRIEKFVRGDAIMAVMGGRTACVDVDPRNGGDVSAVTNLLAWLNVTVFAKVATPGGGAHFYVAGHQNLASVHSGADTPKLRGFPGIDIQSHGTNMFLPGTLRPKYDDRGYTVVFDHLESLADGGDPVGAEAFASWVRSSHVQIQHRVRSLSAGPLGHSTGLIRCVEEAVEGTRNRTLFWALCCAYRERAGADVVDALANAAVRRGLTDLEVQATVRSAARTVGTA
jgi:hypothetical protein